MRDKLTAGMKSWIKQDYQDTYKSRYQLDPELMAHLVLVNDEVGLTEADVEKAVGILKPTSRK